MAENLESITRKLIAFRDERDWKQFHRPKEIALSISLEAAELLELFQWKSDQECAEFVAQKPEQLRDELADIFNWVLVLAHDAGIDIVEASAAKIEKNNAKYPLERVKGKCDKYTSYC